MSLSLLDVRGREDLRTSGDWAGERGAGDDLQKGAVAISGPFYRREQLCVKSVKGCVGKWGSISTTANGFNAGSLPYPYLKPRGCSLSFCLSTEHGCSTNRSSVLASPKEATWLVLNPGAW